MNDKYRKRNNYSRFYVFNGERITLYYKSDGTAGSKFPFCNNRMVKIVVECGSLLSWKGCWPEVTCQLDLLRKIRVLPRMRETCCLGLDPAWDIRDDRLLLLELSWRTEAISTVEGPTWHIWKWTDTWWQLMVGYITVWGRGKHYRNRNWL